MGSGRKWSTQELEQAVYLHDVHKVPWKIIAYRMNLPLESLKVQVCRYRKGVRLPSWTGEKAQRNQQRIARAEQGASLNELAAEWGVSKPAVIGFLDRYGIDSDARWAIWKG